MVERGDEYAPYIMEKIFPHSGKAFYLGVTGPPGAGKSTTVDRLITMLSKNKYRSGSSPSTLEPFFRRSIARRQGPHARKAVRWMCLFAA